MYAYCKALMLNFLGVSGALTVEGGRRGALAGGARCFAGFAHLLIRVLRRSPSGRLACFYRHYSRHLKSTFAFVSPTSVCTNKAESGFFFVHTSRVKHAHVQRWRYNMCKNKTDKATEVKWRRSSARTQRKTELTTAQLHNNVVFVR